MSDARPIMDDSADRDLARRAQAGCSSSFERLLSRYQRPILQFLLARTRSHHDAEDLTQETFVRAWRSLHRYSSGYRFSTWLFTIAHRLAISHARRSRNPEAKVDLDEMHAAGSGPLAEAITREHGQLIWDVAAAVLSEEQVTALWLLYVEQMPPQEIARVLRRSWVSVKVMMFRARRRLEPHVRQLDPHATAEKAAHPAPPVPMAALAPAGRRGGES